MRGPINVLLVMALLLASVGCARTPATVAYAPAVAGGVRVIPDGEVGQTYRGALITAQAGIGSYRFAFAGTPPPGLSIKPFTGAIIGVPTTAGGYRWQVQVTDSAGATVTQTLSITIRPARPK